MNTVDAHALDELGPTRKVCYQFTIIIFLKTLSAVVQSEVAAVTRTTKSRFVAFHQKKTDE